MIRTFAVIGDPIAQSKSPLMHSAAYAALGIEARYVPFHVQAEQLEKAIDGVRALGIQGLNVTIPHKVAVMPLLDEIDPLAIQIGAVNTIVRREGRLIGYNTDGKGYVRSLREEMDFDPRGKRVLFVGAGGACRAIAFTLLSEGVAELVLANRTRSSAEELARRLEEADIAKNPQQMCAIQVVSLDQVEKFVPHADLIINTTSIGMFPNENEMPFHPSGVKKDAIVSDLIYNPLETKLLREAKKYGAKVHGGLGMFVYQGALAFEQWFEQAAPIEAMRQAVLQSLALK